MTSGKRSSGFVAVNSAVHSHLAAILTQESADEIKEALSELRNVVFGNVRL